MRSGASRRAIMAGFLWVFSISFCFPSYSYAVPELISPKVTDVTTTSFCMVWITDTDGKPSIEVYEDPEMAVSVNGLRTEIMPASGNDVIAAAKSKGIVKVRLIGLVPSRVYYARAVMSDKAAPDIKGYSPLLPINTAGEVLPYKQSEMGILSVSNGYPLFKVYVRPSETDNLGGLGDLVLVESAGSPYPVTALVGDGISPPYAFIDLNNVFGTAGTSLDLAGGERIQVTVYRKGLLSSLVHYRIMPEDSAGPLELQRWFFADIDIDGNVIDSDFEIFREHFRTLPDDRLYNPDYNFVQDADQSIDAREFSKFSREYGRTDVK